MRSVASLMLAPVLPPPSRQVSPIPLIGGNVQVLSVAGCLCVCVPVAATTKAPLVTSSRHAMFSVQLKPQRNGISTTIQVPWQGQ
ncbi:unnamed protein product [Boreogadus saida]